MKIYRGPEKGGGDWRETDDLDLSQIDWSPNSSISLDITKDKTGRNHSRVALKLTENDVLSLHGSLINHYKARIISLQDRLDKLYEETSTKSDALSKIDMLLSIHRDKAPSPDDLVDLVQKIVEFYIYKDIATEEDLKVDWVDVESL